MTGLRYNVSAGRLAYLGCTVEQWIKLRDAGLEMIAAGTCSIEGAPIRAYCHQRHAAEHRRNIPWRLTLMQWWEIWSTSGHWPDRGVGRGYMMCRKGDLGAYEVGNVFIGPGAENLSAAAKKCDLPIGVAKKSGSGKPYRAYCNIGGKQRHLGTFDTVEAARAAYLAGLELDSSLRAAA